MTREEMYSSIYTHDTIYIPPHEETCAPLEVALGCSWHKCRFCDFAHDKFQIHPLSKIEYNLQILGQLQPTKRSLFLLGENAFVMSDDYIEKIMGLVHIYMPNIKSFAMYSRIDDILRRTPQDLKHLKSLGLRALHIGVESGSDPILAEMNKGITSDQIIQALHMLDEAGIDYYLTIIPGLGGRNFSRLHASETAALLNQVHPKDIWCLKLILWEGTPIYKDVKEGRFDMMTDAEILLEERYMLENLHVKNCIFEDTTVLNKYTIYGYLPEQKNQLLKAIDYLLAVEGY